MSTGERVVFLSNKESIKYTVRRTIVKTSEQWGREVVPGIHADFRNHRFDPWKAQKEFGWTDEERDHVVKFLLEHEDFGRATSNTSTFPRLYLEGHPAAAKVQITRGGVKVTDPEVRCLWRERTETGSEQCPDAAHPPSPWCVEHTRRMAAQVSEPAATGA